MRKHRKLNTCISSKYLPNSLYYFAMFDITRVYERRLAICILSFWPINRILPVIFQIKVEAFEYWAIWPHLRLFISQSKALR